MRNVCGPKYSPHTGFSGSAVANVRTLWLNLILYHKMPKYDHRCIRSILPYGKGRGVYTLNSTHEFEHYRKHTNWYNVIFCRNFRKKTRTNWVLQSRILADFLLKSTILPSQDCSNFRHSALSILVVGNPMYPKVSRRFRILSHSWRRQYVVI